ncbi:MAG TPA: hypothetical protein VF077_08820 [Nitrospiraceae bacterium]
MREANSLEPSIADDRVEQNERQRSRIALNSPVLRLAVPEIPGYKLYWFRGDAARIQQAVNAGYEFVKRDEVKLNNRDLIGSAVVEDGNTDLGDQVSAIAGPELDGAGQPRRLVLMKIREDWWEEDQKKAIGPGSRLDGVRKSLLKGLIGQEDARGEDREQTYLGKGTKIPEFFRQKAAKPPV